MTIRNNVTRLLDTRGIPYRAFQLPEKKLSGLEVAQYLDVDPMQVFKTIVHTRPEGGKPILALIPAPYHVNRKALAQAVAEKRVKRASQREAEEVTSLQIGGISPLALLNRGFQVVVDRSAVEQKEIYISGGQRGLNILLPVVFLIELTKATLASISQLEPKGALNRN